MKCCMHCCRIVNITTTAPYTYYCMALQKHVNPLEYCAWFMPMSGYEEERKE